jgi:hypothetical protein
MVQPLESARRKVARAKEHISKLEAEIMAFFDASPYAGMVKKRHPQELKHEVYKLRFNQDLPDSFANLTSDALHNLRDSLDNAAYALAVASGKAEPQSAAFPFGGSEDEFENSVKGRCKDVPDEVCAIFRDYQPYKGGNDFLWALNKLAVTDKHKLLTISPKLTLGAVAGRGFVSTPMNPTWDGAKREFEVLTVMAGQDQLIEGNIRFYLDVSFAEVPFVAGESVIRLLNYFVELVEHILSRLDTEARNLGLVH